MSRKNITVPKYVFKLISYHTAVILKVTPGVAMTQYLRSTYSSSICGDFATVVGKENPAVKEA